MMLYELSGTDEAEEVPSNKPDHWKAQCSEILMQKVSVSKVNALIGIEQVSQASNIA